MKSTPPHRKANNIAVFTLIALIVLTAAGCQKQFARLQDNQLKLQHLIEANNRQISALADQTAESHEALGSQIENGDAALAKQAQANTAKLAKQAGANTADLSAQLSAVRNNQADLAKAVVNNEQKMAQATAALENNQGRLEDLAKEILAAGAEAAQHLKTLSEDQVMLCALVEHGASQIQSGVADIGRKQRLIRDKLDHIDALSQTLSAQNTGIAATQKKLQAAVQSNHKDTTAKVAQLAAAQQKLQSDVTTLADNQQGISTGVRTIADARQNIRTALANLDKGQQKLQTGLSQNQSKLEASLAQLGDTGNKINTNLGLIESEQTKLAETIHTDSQYMRSRVEAIEQRQKEWQSRLQTVHKKMTSLGQSLSELRDTLLTIEDAIRSDVDNVTELIAGRTEQIGSFQTKITDDLHTVNNFMTELRQLQARLEERLTQIEQNTQSQTDHIMIAVDQLRDPQQAPHEPALTPIEVNVPAGAFAK